METTMNIPVDSAILKSVIASKTILHIPVPRLSQVLKE